VFSVSDFKPWIKYPSLSRERLSVVANIIRHVRAETALLHEPKNGDTDWSLGCRAYSRTCHAIREAAKTNQWLRVLPETANLQFSFGIGEIPFRFYRGKADDPPERYLASTFGEIHHVQAALDIDGLRPLDKILRLAIEPVATSDVYTVTLVEVDEAGNVTETFVIPFVGEVETGKVSPLESKPVDVPPPTLEPIHDTQEEKPTDKTNELKFGSK
jgi:hypothetical protein